MITAQAMRRPGPSTMFPQGIMGDLPRAARMAMDKFLWAATGFGEIDDRVTTDREIAEAVGCSIRTAQEAVRQLCNFAVDGVARPIAERYFKYGSRRECGRVIRFVAPEIVPVPVEGPAPAARKGKGKGDSGQIPNVGAVPPATPEQLAAAAAAQEAASPPSDAPNDPESSARALDALREALGQVKRPKAKLPKSRPTIDLDAPGPKAGPVSIGSVLGKLMGRPDPSGPPAQPSGP
jgi:hypothetical protein